MNCLLEQSPVAHPANAPPRDEALHPFPFHALPSLRVAFQSHKMSRESRGDKTACHFERRGIALTPSSHPRSAILRGLCPLSLNGRSVTAEPISLCCRKHNEPTISAGSVERHTESAPRRGGVEVAGCGRAQCSRKHMHPTLPCF